MKTTYKYTFGFLTIFVLIIACTKEVGLYTEVEFEISETHVSDGFINTPLATSITVTPEELVEGYSYTYSYKINSGEGYFQDESGTTISEGEKIGLSPLSAALNYIATKIGDHSVTFTAEDTFGFQEQVTASYSISDVPVTWTATGPSGQVLLGSSQDITVILGSETTATGVTYERNYSFTQGTGTITSSTSGASETLAEFVSITPGTFTLTYVATELGQTTLEFLLRDSNGQEILQTVSFEVVDELDTTSPVITLIGGDISLVVGETYTDQGATALDDVDGDITDNIVIVNPVDTNVPDTYILTYNVTDAAGNDAVPVTRTVTITNDDQDSVKPVITLIGDDVTITVGDTYTDQGATANDDVDGDITDEISIVNLVDPTVADTYTVTYNVTDAAGNDATEVTRTVIVSATPDTTAPLITRNGPASISLTVGDTYSDAGATALDDVDGDITADISIVNLVDPTVADTYTVTYNVTDAAGNDATEVTRTVIVSATPDTTAPMITRNGPASISLTVGDTYSDAGATALDDVDGDITADISIVDLVDPNVAGTYTVTYNVSDAAGNDATEVTRTVIVSPAPDTTAPIITRNGPASISLTVGDTYSDAGATALDDVDGDITADISIVDLVDPNVVGTYTVTYNVSDAAGNDATEVTRTVIVSPAPDTTAPVITRNGPASISLTVGDTYSDAGATALDDVDGDITADISIVDLVDPNVADTYTVTYNVTDAAGNDAAEVTRTVIVSLTSFDPDTGIYLAPPGSIVGVYMSSNGSSSGTANFSGGGGSMTTCWGSTCTQNSNSYQFTMPESGSVTFSGSHVSSGDSANGTNGSIQAQGESRSFSMNVGVPIPRN